MNTRDIDMLHGSLWNKIILFALPLALTGVMQQLLNAADVVTLGKFVGAPEGDFSVVVYKTIRTESETRKNVPQPFIFDGWGTFN